jgi:hypothetical protein
MSEVVRTLGDRGVTRLRLDVVAANVRSITFYRRLGAIPLVMHPTPRSSVNEMTMVFHGVTLPPATHAIRGVQMTAGLGP